jgi:hypothetical protein
MSSQPFPFDQPHPVPDAGVVERPPPRPREPLGLPAGSVRAVLILLVMSTISTLLLMEGATVPLYLYYLLFLTTGAYFASRSKSPHVAGEPAPLYLPRGSIRGLIVLAFAVVLGVAIYRDPSGFFHRPLLDQIDQKETVVLPVVMLGVFFLGIIVSWISHKLLAGPEGMPAWYQDVQAWVAMLAVLGLGTMVILEVVVFPSMQEPPKLHVLEMILSAVVAFYFGARA